MGDEIPMKKLVLISILTTAIFANTENENISLVAEYKAMFEKIGQKRIGVDERDIDDLKAPFATVAPKVKVVEGEVIKPSVTNNFSLEAIINKRAKISGKWYKLRSEVHGMKIVSVGYNYVWLKNDEFRKKLTLGNKNEKISIK